MSKLLVFSALFILLVVNTFSQTATLKGKLLISKSSQSVAGVLIKLSNEKNNKILTTFSDNEGNFVFINVPSGEYKLKENATSFSHYETHINLKDNQTKYLEIQLTEKINNLENVSVFSKINQENENASRLNEKNATNIINVVSAKAMERSPDINAANVLQRISGVTIQKNSGGDEAFAMVRGLEPRYNNTLVNGVKITSPDDKARYVSLDIIPSDLLQKIEISKTLLPEMEGDAIGGTVNLIMKDAPDSMVLKATSSISYNQLFFDRKYTTFSKRDIQQKSFIERNGLYTPALPSDFSKSNLDFKQIQALPSGTLGATYGKRILNNKLGFIVADNFQNQYFGVNSVFNTISPDIYKNQPYISDVAVRYFSTQQTNNGLTAHIDYNINDHNKIVLNNLFLYTYFAQARTEIDTAYIGGNGGRTVPGTGPVTNTYTSITNQQFLENLKLSGKHILSKYLLLDWAGIFSLATKRAPDRSDLVINTKIDTVHTTNNISGPYTFRKTPYYFDDIPRLWQHNKDIDYDFITNATYKTHIKENALEFKAGGLYRHKERSNRADQYDLKPTANADGSKQYFTNIYTAQWLVFNPTGNGNFNANDYDAHEDIIAGFGQAKFVSNNFELFGGIRVENTDQAFNIQSESYTQITHATINYLDVLPSIMLKYKVTTKSSIRIAYNKSLSRPNYYELVPYVIPSNTTSNDEAGNPGLKHAIADNFDVRYELFPKGEEEILIGAFYKQIQDPIEYVYVNNTTYSPKNLGNATIGGIELSCTKYWGSFGLTGNYTYIKSTVSSPKSYTDLVAGTTIQKLQSRPMQGQTDNTLNVSLLYKNEKKKVFVQLAYQYLGKSLSLVYPIYGADYYQQPQSSLSLSAEKDLNKHFIVFGKFNNLLNTSTTTKINNLIGINDSFRPIYTLGLRYSY